MSPTNTELDEKIRELAIKIYLDLPFYKRWQFIKWNKTNGWDVKHIFDDCVDEARFLLGAYIRKN